MSKFFPERSVSGSVKKNIIPELAAIFLICCSLFGCASGNSGEIPTGSTRVEDPAVNMVKSNPAAVGLSIEEAVDNIPFTSYTYDFSVYGSNYMITAAPNETRTGLVLTIENNNFEYSTFNVYPPEGYAVYLPYSQTSAASVCTVIRGAESGGTLPDLLKIDFYLADAENEALPYVVSRLYTVADSGEMIQIKVMGKPQEASVRTLAVSYAISQPEEDKEKDNNTIDDAAYELVPLEYIPESSIYQAEPMNPQKFMAAPIVTALDDGNFDVKIVTYELNADCTEMIYTEEDCTPENPIYFGYAAHAIAGEIYKYFRTTSFNVSDYDNYVEIPSTNGESSQYFFKVDDPRFSTVQELRQFAEKYFAKNIVDEMFLSAPQQYRDIDGALYTIVGDSGYDETLGKLIFTGEMEEDLTTDVKNLSFYTRQEKFDENHEFTGYIDGGKFSLEFTDSEPGFIITQYRYPY